MTPQLYRTSAATSKVAWYFRKNALNWYSAVGSCPETTVFVSITEIAYE